MTNLPNCLLIVTAEVDAAVVVLFLGGQEIEIRESNLPGMARSQIVERLTDDGVVANLQLMTVFENENG